MAGTKIKLKDQLGRVVRVGGDGTNGATIGKDLRWPDGSLVQESQVRNSGGQAGGSSGNSTGGSTGASRRPSGGSSARCLRTCRGLRLWSARA